MVIRTEAPALVNAAEGVLPVVPPVAKVWWFADVIVVLNNAAKFVEAVITLVVLLVSDELMPSPNHAVFESAALVTE